MTDEEDLFQAVLADPDDETPRLIYADRLEELGDPRAEFIRVQCELARLPAIDPYALELWAREQALLGAHRKRWNGAIHRRLASGPLRNQVGRRRRPIRGWAYRRGFVEEAVLHARVLVDHPDDLFGIGPLRRLAITDARGWVAALGASPFLERLDLLVFRPGSLDRADARALVRTPSLVRISRLWPSSPAYWTHVTGLAANDPRLAATLRPSPTILAV